MHYSCTRRNHLGWTQNQWTQEKLNQWNRIFHIDRPFSSGLSNYEIKIMSYVVMKFICCKIRIFRISLQYLKRGLTDLYSCLHVAHDSMIWVLFSSLLLFVLLFELLFLLREVVEVVMWLNPVDHQQHPIPLQFSCFDLLFTYINR